jgi:hypothetical protein
VKDRDGAELLLRQARRLFPCIERIIDDAGYQGLTMAAAVRRCSTLRVEIVLPDGTALRVSETIGAAALHLVRAALRR